MCPECGWDFFFNTEIITEKVKGFNDFTRPLGLGAIYLVCCEECGNEFPYFKGTQDVEIINHAIKIARENSIKGTFGGRGIDIATLMLFPLSIDTSGGKNARPRQ